MEICSPLDCMSEVLQDVPDLAFAFHPDGRYLYANKAGASYLQHEPEDVIGFHWRELGLQSPVMEELMSHVTNVFETAQPEQFVLHGSERFGSRVFDMSMTPLHCERSEVVCVLAIAHDVTEYLRPAE